MEQWSEIERLFHAALALPAKEREAFLLTTVPENARLREEVAALLESAMVNDTFLEGSPVIGVQNQPAALTGERLGHFEILQLIGRGGMGEVYRARDVRLGRDVALKVLPQPFASDHEWRTRLQREARAASALNHPNICTIHGLEESASRLMIVMELVEGETLHTRLTKGRLPIAQAFTIAIQLADALDAAHSRGVIHRDLKPANLMVTRSGLKVLDFGIAKLDRGADLEQVSISHDGALVGTPQYMSPEQLNGGKVDARSDIFSFGLILYELFAGQPAFQAPTPAALIGAILHTEPISVRDVQTDTPASVERIITVCLAKDPADRFQSARDLKRALEWARESPSSAPGLPSTRRSGSPWIVASAIVCLATAVVWLWPRERQAEPVNWVATISVPGFRASGGRVEMSPDGSMLFYYARGQYWLRQAHDTRITFLRGTENAPFMFWSFDSRHVAYILLQPGGLKVLMKRLIPDGAPQKVAEFREGGGNRGGTWSPNGTILFANQGQLFTVSDSGGTPRRLPLPDLNHYSYLWPEFLPNGEDFLVLRRAERPDESQIHLATLRNGKLVTGPTMLMQNVTAGHFSPANGGQLLFVRDDNLFAQRLDLGARKLIGEPRLVQRGVGSTPAESLPDFSVSRNGILAWRPGRAALIQLKWFDRKGKPLGLSGTPGLTTHVYLSPDEKQIISAARGETHLLDPSAPGYRRLEAGWPIWTSDSAHIVYLKTADDGKEMLMQAPVSQIGLPRQLRQLPQTARLHDISPDGRHVLYWLNAALYYSPIGGRQDEAHASQAIRTDERINQGRFSPDGRWIVYSASRNTTGPMLYVQSFPPGGYRIQIAPDGGMFPVWRGDGEEILFLRQRQILAVKVGLVDGKMQATTPQTLFELPDVPPYVFTGASPIAVTRDGSRILVTQPVDQPASEVIHIATAWNRH